MTTLPWPPCSAPMPQRLAGANGRRSSRRRPPAATPAPPGRGGSGGAVVALDPGGFWNRAGALYLGATRPPCPAKLTLVDDEPATVAWFAIRFGRGEYGIFDVFPDEAGRAAHLSTVARLADALEGFIADEKLDGIVISPSSGACRRRR